MKKQTKREDLSHFRLVMRQFRKHRVAQAGIVILALLYLMVLFCEFVAPYDPQRRLKVPYMPPEGIHFVDPSGRFHLRPFVYGYTATFDRVTYRRTYIPNKKEIYPIHLFIKGDPYRLLGLFPGDIHLFGVENGGLFLIFGSDDLGHDLFSQIVYGSRISLTVGLIGVVIILVLGISIGGISGLYGGAVDNIIQRLIEVIRSIPTIPLWLGLAAALPPNWPQVKMFFAIVIIISLIGWTTLARVVRGKFIALREEDFVMAARVCGTSQIEIIVRHMIPNFMGYILVNATITIPAMILGETALSFLGLGLRPPTISWGVLLQKAQSFQTIAFYPWLLIPGFFVVIAVLAFNVVGDGLRDAVDPYSELRR